MDDNYTGSNPHGDLPQVASIHKLRRNLPVLRYLEMINLPCFPALRQRSSPPHCPLIRGRVWKSQNHQNSEYRDTDTCSISIIWLPLFFQSIYLSASRPPSRQISLVIETDSSHNFPIQINLPRENNRGPNPTAKIPDKWRSVSVPQL